MNRFVSMVLTLLVAGFSAATSSVSAAHETDPDTKLALCAVQTVTVEFTSYASGEGKIGSREYAFIVTSAHDAEFKIAILQNAYHKEMSRGRTGVTTTRRIISIR